MNPSNCDLEISFTTLSRQTLLNNSNIHVECWVVSMRDLFGLVFLSHPWCHTCDRSGVYLCQIIADNLMNLARFCKCLVIKTILEKQMEICMKYKIEKLRSPTWHYLCQKKINILTSSRHYNDMAFFALMTEATTLVSTSKKCIFILSYIVIKHKRKTNLKVVIISIWILAGRQVNFHP